MSATRVFKPFNPLTSAVAGDKGLRVDRVLKSADEQLQRMQDPMRASLRAWVMEILAASGEPAPNLVRLAWLANGVLGVAGACGLEALARCGGLLGRAIEAMGPDGWRVDAARLYAASMVRLLDGASAVEEAAVLASLEAMTKRLASAAG